MFIMVELEHFIACGSHDSSLILYLWSKKTLNPETKNSCINLVHIILKYIHFNNIKIISIFICLVQIKQVQSLNNTCYH